VVQSILHLLESREDPPQIPQSVRSFSVLCLEGYLVFVILSIVFRSARSGVVKYNEHNIFVPPGKLYFLFLQYQYSIRANRFSYNDYFWECFVGLARITLDLLYIDRLETKFWPGQSIHIHILQWFLCLCVFIDVGFGDTIMLF
jgi:hypothetical protein